MIVCFPEGAIEVAGGDHGVADDFALDHKSLMACEQDHAAFVKCACQLEEEDGPCRLIGM